MSELLYEKERRMYVTLRTVARGLDRRDVVEACDRVIDFIDERSPRLSDADGES